MLSRTNGSLVPERSAALRPLAWDTRTFKLPADGAQCRPASDMAGCGSAGFRTTPNFAFIRLHRKEDQEDQQQQQQGPRHVRAAPIRRARYI